MAVIRIKRSSDFTVIPNHVFELVQDAKALGVLCFLLSKPPSWQTKPDHLQKHFGVGRDYIRGALKVLRELGFAELVVDRNDSGKVIGKHYDIFDTPSDGKPVLRQYAERRENRTTEKPTVGKPVDIVSTDEEVNTEEEVSTTRENAQAREISSIVQPEPAPEPESHGASDVPTSTPPKYDLESLIHLWIDKATRSSVVRNYEGDPEKLKQAAEAAAAHYIGKELEYPAKDESMIGLALEKSTGSSEALKLTRWLQRRSQFESKPKQSRNGKLTFEERKENAAASVNAAREAGRRYAERKRREAEGDFGHYAVG
jgi:chemotaxis protein histidine kinase CheA